MAEASRQFDLTPAEIESWVDDGKRGMPRYREGRRGTPWVWAGQLRLRPEVDAVVPVLEAQSYVAVPRWRHDGPWELWTQEGNITSGPSETFGSLEEAIAVGRDWRRAIRE